MSYVRHLAQPMSGVWLEADDAPANLEAAYTAITAELRRDPLRWRAWKLGGTNAATRAAFQVRELYYGALAEDEIVEEPGVAPGFPLFEKKGEVEIALRVGPGGRGYDAWCLSLEMPSSPILNLPAAGVAALVADRCGAGALVLGPVREGAVPSFEHARFALVVDGTTVSSSGVEALTGSPASILDDFLHLAHAHGLAPRAGDWVATGGITACCPLPEGAHVEVKLDGRAEISFRASYEPGDHG